MKNCRAQSDGCRRNQDERIGVCKREREQARHRQAHPGRKRMRHRPLVRHKTDERLEQRRRALKCEGDPSKLRVVQMKRITEHGINGRQQSLDGVVQAMGEADGKQHRHDGGVRQRRAANGHFLGLDL